VVRTTGVAIHSQSLDESSGLRLAISVVCASP
jgi:hypothetical protein